MTTDAESIKHLWTHKTQDHPFLSDEELVIDRAEGVWVWTEQGKKLMDGFAGLAVVNVGHGRREIAEAIAEQTVRLAYYPTTRQFVNRPAAELAAPLRDELLQALEQSARRLARARAQRVDRAAQGLDLLSSRFAHAMTALRPQRQRLDLLAQRGRAALAQRLQAASSSLAHAAQQWQRAAASGIEKRAMRLSGVAGRLGLLDPQQVLSRGYALIETEAGRVVVAPSQLHAGQRLTISLAEGQADLVPREVRAREA